MLAANNQWVECLELAQRNGGEFLTRYLIRYAKQTMEAGRFGETI
jgi:intraflagellar transport protein 172